MSYFFFCLLFADLFTRHRYRAFANRLLYRHQLFSFARVDGLIHGKANAGAGRNLRLCAFWGTELHLYGGAAPSATTRVAGRVLRAQEMARSIPARRFSLPKEQNMKII